MLKKCESCARFPRVEWYANLPFRKCATWRSGRLSPKDLANTVFMLGHQYASRLTHLAQL
jgi:hypothetical protein